MQELDQLRKKAPRETGQEEPEGSVSTNDAMDIIRKVRAPSLGSRFACCALLVILALALPNCKGCRPSHS